MDIKKSVKYIVVAGIIGALALAPASKAIAAVTGEEARQLELTRQAQAFVEEATSPVNQTVAGTKSQVGGFYVAKKVQGVAMAPAADSGAAKESFVKVTDTDKKKSTAAVAVADTAAASLSPGAVVGPCINVQYGKMEKGKYVETTDGSKGELNIGVPANFRSDNAKYAIIAVYEKGLYKVYENTSTDPTKITVNVDEAASANVMYALVKY